MAASFKHCVLVVDDEPDLVQSVKDLLRFEYRVLTATRASDGLAIMKRETVHIVMTDQRMPEMSGVEFLKQLKDGHPEAIRLLFTAYSDVNAVTDAINEGNVYRYIAKPWEPEELRSVLRQAVAQYELQAERKRLVQEVQEKNRQLEGANAELRRANDLKRAFIRVASHELRTPLTIVMGLSELAIHAPTVPAPLDAWMTQMHKASIRLNDRIEQVVKMLQAERFERPLDRKPTAVAPLLRAAAGEVRSFIQQRHQTLQVDASENLGDAFIEPAKIQDSLVQLLANAIKFTPDGGNIRLSARRLPDDGVEIAVADTGMGIDAASLPRIFESFFTRFDVSGHSSGDFEYDRRGLGLGLAMVKLFVDMHGGRVKVQSEVGKGTTVTIALPSQTPQAAPGIESSAR